MANPYIGEIRMFGGTFAPLNWRFCDGSIVPISEYDTLFNLIGTTYGGDGVQTFGLPDLRGRVPLHAGSGFTFGALSGNESVTLTSQQLPSHNHFFAASGSNAGSAGPGGMVVASGSSMKAFTSANLAASFAPNAIGMTGGNQPHSNLQPFQCVNFIISMYGIYPPPN